MALKLLLQLQKSPISAKIAKTIAGGVIAGAAIPLALNQITGLALTAADYVLDKENNAIRYKVPVDQIKCYKVSEPSGVNGSFKSVNEACRAVTTSVYAKSFALDNEYMCQRSYNSGYESYARVISTSCPSTIEPEWRSVPIPTVADKIYDNAKTGHADSVAVATAAVADLTKEGAYDTPLDLAKPEDKTCEAGYVKNSAGECVKKDEPTTCPAGSIKVGDRCITPPEPEEDGSCGDCCEQLLEAISALSTLQTALNQKLLDSDDKTRQELSKIQDKIDLLATDLKSINDNIVRLTYEAKKINSTLEELDDNQELRFQNLTDTINQANQELLDSDKITQEKLDKTNELLTQSLDEFKKTNEKLDKVNENLEKMQKCNETEFNKKVCDFVDWFQDEPTLTDEPKPPIKDIEAENSNKIDMAGSCPAPYQINFSVFGHSQNNSISYQPLCDALEMLKPIFVGAGALSSMFILMGYSRPNSTGVND